MSNTKQRANEIIGRSMRLFSASFKSDGALAPGVYVEQWANLVVAYRMGLGQQYSTLEIMERRDPADAAKIGTVFVTNWTVDTLGLVNVWRRGAWEDRFIRPRFWPRSANVSAGTASAYVLLRETPILRSDSWARAG